MIHIKERERVVNNHFYHMVHKKEEGTYHHIETLMKEMPGFLSPGRGLPLLLIPEYSGINKEQRIPDRSKTAHRKPPVKCFLTGDQVFVEHSHCDLSPPPSLPLGFLGVQLAHLLRQMSTVQNPKKSWLATKPACSLVDDASLGPRVPPSGSGCPRLLVSGGGWAGPQLASSVQSFVL